MRKAQLRVLIMFYEFSDFIRLAKDYLVKKTTFLVKRNNMAKFLEKSNFDRKTSRLTKKSTVDQESQNLTKRSLIDKKVDG